MDCGSAISDSGGSGGVPQSVAPHRGVSATEKQGIRLKPPNGTGTTLDSRGSKVAGGVSIRGNPLRRLRKRHFGDGNAG